MHGLLNEKYFHTLKLIIATVCAMLLAEGFHLEYSISAGVIAILTIQPTKRETVFTAFWRFCAFVVALVVAYGCFEWIGFRIRGFIVFVILYICICQFFNWQHALTLNAVLISHFVGYGVMNWQTIRNELLIFFIGTGFGVLANLHLRKRVDYIEMLKKDADEQIVSILSYMSDCVMQRANFSENDECFIVLKRQIRKAKNVAEENINNQFRTDNSYDKEYILMRDRQYDILHEMYRNVRALHSTPSTAQKLSEFLELTAQAFHRENDCRELMERFQEMNQYMKSHPLPMERKEFEDRARLYVLMRNIEEFLQVKMEFAAEYMIEKKTT